MFLNDKWLMHFQMVAKYVMYWIRAYNIKRAFKFASSWKMPSYTSIMFVSAVWRHVWNTATSLEHVQRPDGDWQLCDVTGGTQPPVWSMCSGLTVIGSCAAACMQWWLTPVVQRAMSILTQRTMHLMMKYILQTVGITFKRLRLFLLMLISPMWHHTGMNWLRRGSNTGHWRLPGSWQVDSIDPVVVVLVTWCTSQEIGDVLTSNCLFIIYPLQLLGVTSCMPQMMLFTIAWAKSDLFRTKCSNFCWKIVSGKAMHRMTNQIRIVTVFHKTSFHHFYTSKRKMV